MAQKILIIQTAFVGDLLLSIPMIRRVRVLYPQHHIQLLCRKGLGEFLLTHRLVDSIIEIDKSEEGRKGSLASLKDLKNETFDLVVCPHQSVTSARISASVKSPIKIGYKKFWNFLAFHHRVERPMYLPEAMRQLSLLECIDDEIKEKLAPFHKEKSSEAKSLLMDVNSGKMLPQWARMDLPILSRTELATKLNEEPRFYQAMEKIFQLAQKTKVFDKDVIFLAPGSVWQTKRWTLQGYIELGKNLRRRGFHVAVVGAPDEQEICQELTKAVQGSVNFCGQTSLFETFLLFQKGKALVCNDSGAMHLASVAGLPAVSIFGPTTLQLGYRPWQQRARVVEVDLSCRPCGKHGSKECPIGTHQCMKDINDLMVMDALNDLLQEA